MSSEDVKKRRWRIFATVCLAGYVGTHFALSWISCLRVQRDWCIRDSFIYLPVKPDLVANHERPLLYIHHAQRWFFLPIWKLDNCILGGPYPMRSISMRSLDGSSHSSKSAPR